MSLLDFTQPGSDPNNPNTFIQTPDQVARMRALAQTLGQEGSSTAPIQSGWQGAANLAKALTGVGENWKANRTQQAGMSQAAANLAAATGAAPAPPALAAALGGGQPQPGAPGNPALATALGAPPNANIDPRAAGGAPMTQPPQTAPLAPGPAMPAGAGQASPLAGLNSDARGMRNNNPGNLESNSWTQGLPGYVGTDGRFAIFNSPAAGQAALDRNLQGYGSKGINTPLAIASTWAPGSEAGNDPSSYGGAISQALGVGLHDPVNMADPATRAKIGQAIALVENGPARSGASPAVAAIGAATGGQSSPAQAAGAIPAPGGPQGAGAAASAPAPSQAPGGFHPNVQALLNVLSDPWSTPAQQQVATAMLQSQLPTPPTFGVIGKDAITGNEQYGWISPKTQTVTPANPGASAGGGAGGPALPAPGAAPAGGAAPGAMPGAASGAPAPAPSPVPGGVPPVASAVNMGAANGMTPQGATYLNGLEAQGGSGAVVARQARAIINGQAPLPEANAATKPVDVAIRDAVFRAAPEFSSSVAKARSDMVTQFGDKTSPTSAGGMIVSANAALHHLSALADSADQLGNVGSPGVNWLKNEGRWAIAGNPALQAYDLNKQALAEEIGKMYKGGTPAESEIRAMVSSLSPSMTPAEQSAVFSKISTLLQGKTTELQRQWQSAFGANSSYPVIGDEAQGVIKRFSSPGGAPGIPAAASAPVATVKTPDDVKHLPSGTRFLIPDGSGRIGVAP